MTRHIAVLMLISFSLFAQAPNFQNFEGKITGKVIDSLDKSPLEYVNLVLTNQKDGSIAAGTITSPKGTFTLDKLTPGKFDLSVSFIGYQTRVFKDLLITPKNPSIDFGTLLLVPSSVNLDEVVVNAEKELITNHLDKKVITVDKDLTSAGGTATDVLQNVPSIQVDADGTVSYRGNTNLTILIDGRPAGMSGLSASDILAQIPASNIEAIELVTNPSAKYDPEGTAGIINIKLKKKGHNGFNGVASVNAGTGDKYNSSLNFNLKQGDFNFFGNYDNRFNYMNFSSETFRENYLSGGTTFLDQYTAGTNRFQNHTAGFGADYYFSERATLTLAYQFRWFSPAFRNTLENENFNAANTLMRSYIRKTTADREMESNNFTMTYKRTFEKKDRELLTDVMYNSFSMDRVEEIYTQDTDVMTGAGLAPFMTNGISINSNKQWVIQTNYIEPFSDKTKLEAGFKSQIKNLSTKNDSYNLLGGSWVEDATQKNYFNYDEQIHAVYATLTSEIGKFKYLLGLRGEQLIAEGNVTSQNQKFESDYFQVYPSAHVGYNLAQGNDLLLSYSKRVDRPNNRQLNPFRDVADSTFIVAGNPNLKAQYTDALEFEYQGTFGFTSLTASLFYKQTGDIISMVSSMQPDGALYSTFENIADGKNIGTELVLIQPLAKWLRLSATYSYYQASVKGGTVANPIDNKGNSWTTRVNANFVISPDFTLQLVGMYNSPSISMQMGFGGGGSTVMAQGRVKEMYGIDLAGKKDFFEGKLSLTARVSDIFNTRKFASEGTGAGFYLNTTRKFDSRVVYLGLSYRLDTKYRERRIKTTGEDEM
ncbi:MAG: TonB-dependent receptor family protein [Ignavibacteriaceae bacterium]|nr:TonB-dependent receptor family protein [Ignavibacteriaceae bacterium]